MPILNIRIAKPAVKYFVVNQANALGSFKAQSVKTTVQTGNRFVSAPDTRMYVSNHVGSDLVDGGRRGLGDDGGARLLNLRLEFD